MTTERSTYQENNHKSTFEYRDNPEAKRESNRSLQKWSKYVYLLLGLGGIGLGFFFARPMLISSSDSPPAESQERVLPVETIKVQPVDSYQVSRTYTGEIAAIRSSNIGFSRSGEIEAVLVEEGDRVNSGQPLAKLDIRNLEKRSSRRY